MKSLSPFEITGLDALTEYSNLTEHDLLRASIAAINDSAMLTMMDRDGSILHANEKFCAHAGYSQKEIVGKRHDILHTKSAQKVKHYAMLEQLHRCGTWRGTLPLRHKNGTDIWTHTTVTPILNSTAEPDWYLCLHHDITDSKRTEQALMQIRLREAQMLKMGADWYWEIDRNFRFTTLSDGIRRVGEDPARYIGKCRWELSADGDDLKWKEHRATLLAHKPFTSFEYRIRSEAAPNQWKWFCTSGEPCFDEAGQFSGYRGLGRETTFQRNQQEAMWRLANVDSLTGLPNRLQFIEALHQAIRNPSHLTTALMLIDLDNFKSFNDSHGLQAGDSLLIALAQHLTDTLLPSDFVARIASDEFAVIRQGLKTVGELTDTLDVLIHSLQAERNQSELTKQSISIGVSLHPTDAKTAEDLLKDAQLALHVAKRNGGNQHVIFTQEHYRSAASQSELIEKMHQALDKGELVLHYQPIVDPRNRIIIGLEALLRWKSPQDGLLAPGAFWGSFDNMALASRIGQFVLREAIEQAGRWKRQQIPYGKVAVNVTSADFVAGGFTKSLKQLLDSNGLTPAELCIEVTEGMFLGASANRVTRELLGLTEMGVEIAFDDFGTGYASLMHLKLPIDRIKIDRCFVNNIETDATNSAIVHAVANLGHTLGKSITVEGVETLAQSHILQDMGCLQQQGYLFSRPLPAEMVAGFIREFAHQNNSISEICK